MKFTKKNVEAMAEELGMEYDETVHFLVDCGEINTETHRRLLSPKERERVYPSSRYCTK